MAVVLAVCGAVAQAQQEAIRKIGWLGISPASQSGGFELTRRELRALKVFGFTALGIGLSLIVLIIWAEIFGYR